MKTPTSNRNAIVHGSLTTSVLGRRWRQPELIKVTDRVYSATGYAISNVLYIITDNSLVVIDTTESPQAARASFDEFRKISELPVSHIIYTHFHGDHIRGARVFYTAGTKIIAQKRMLDELARLEAFLPYRRRADSVQFGAALDVEERGISLACYPIKGHAPRYVNHNSQHRFNAAGYVPPDTIFDNEYRFEEGGVAFELYHTLGETSDHLMVWLPEEKVLFPGDLFYRSFPMLSNPLKPDRPVLAWIESLGRMRALRPTYLVPSHGKPMSGVDDVDAALANYAEAIRHVHDETVKLINQGVSVEEIRGQVHLPARLARLPYLKQRYGTVRWAVNGIFRHYTGWYHTFNPTDLRPSPRRALYQAILEATGGIEPLLRRSQKALEEGQNQIALELADIVLGVKPRTPRARLVRLQALTRLGRKAENVVEQNIYRTAARTLGAELSSSRLTLPRGPGAARASVGR